MYRTKNKGVETIHLTDNYDDLTVGREYKKVGEGRDFVTVRAKFGLINVPSYLIDSRPLFVENDLPPEEEEFHGDFL